MICIIEDLKVVSLHLNKEPPDNPDAHWNWEKKSLEVHTVQEKKAPC